MTASTDTGHKDDTAEFAIEHPPSIASNLLRQREHIDGVVAAGHVGLGCHAELGSSHRASAGGNGNVLPAIDRIGDGAANSLRRKARLPNDLARAGIERAQVMVQAAVE